MSCIKVFSQKTNENPTSVKTHQSEKDLKDGAAHLLHILIINIQSIKNKLNELEVILHTEDIQLVGISEHWLNDYESNSLTLENYSVSAQTNLCTTSFMHEIFRRKNDRNCVSLPTLGIIFINIYRPPAGNLNRFLEILSNLTQKIL